MFCPKCGSTHPDDLNYCKACGADLKAVRGALIKGAPQNEGIDWSRTWLADMVLTRDEMDRRDGITPEMKRRREIKSGIITVASGISLAVVLSVLLEAIVINGNISELARDILSRVWIVGLMPVLVGLAIIFNGVFLSKKTAADPSQTAETSPSELPEAGSEELPPAQPFASVTDRTTRHLDEAHAAKVSSR